MITTTIVNESEYRRRVYDFFQSILNGRLMSIDANSASDHTIASFVTGYNEMNHSIIMAVRGWK